MKNFLLSSLFIFIIFLPTASAQHYFLEPSSTWTETYWNAFSSDIYSKKFTLDTIPFNIDGKTYFEILSTDEFLSTDWTATGFFIRTAGSHVFLHRHGEEKLLYDFDAEVGNVYTTAQDVEIRVESIDTILLLNDEYRRRFHMVCTYDESMGFYWIEGLGSNLGLVGNAACLFDWYSILSCFFLDGNLLFHNPEADSCWTLITSEHKILTQPVQIFPNPFDEMITIEMDDALFNSVILTDITGRVVSKGNNRVLETSGILPGSYIISVRHGNGKNLNQKLIKLR